ncbi:hypothetical protein OS493_001552 [Desmophyllum pertusum]|uniref:Uncharacterized protein n=1 Tax=Desmophyllum pertusum TaxID=174260 RepID=A0A9X0CZ90_9CNID|nr:hypothetical protein OS493_001552 [Desmophyllum pertusum]
MAPKKVKDSQTVRKDYQPSTSSRSVNEKKVVTTISTCSKTNDSDQLMMNTNEEESQCSNQDDKAEHSKQHIPVKVSPKPDEIIGYVQTVSPLKRNRSGTMDYSDVTFQVHGGKRQRAVCFSKTKRQLSKDSETFFINDMTYISNPRPEEYSFQFEDQYCHSDIA